MKDFDQERIAAASERDVSFKIGGEEFHVRRHLPPEILSDYTFSGTTEEVIAGWDTWVLRCIEPDEADKWRAVRKDAKPPISLNDVEVLGRWLLTAVTGRPFEPPLSSTSTPEPKAATRKAA